VNKRVFAGLLGRKQSRCCGQAARGAGIWPTIEPPGHPAGGLSPSSIARAPRCPLRRGDGGGPAALPRNPDRSKLPNPSVEALLHAFLRTPSSTHPRDRPAGPADQSNAAELCRSLWRSSGLGSLWMPVSPCQPRPPRGYEAAELAPVCRDRSWCCCLQHGLFSFGATRSMSYDRNDHGWCRREELLLSQAERRILPARAGRRPTPAVEALLPVLRGLAAPGRRAEGAPALACWMLAAPPCPGAGQRQRLKRGSCGVVHPRAPSVPHQGRPLGAAAGAACPKPVTASLG